MCGWSRPNTFRERFLTTQDDRERLVIDLDVRGRLLLDADRVREIVKEVESERASRGNWRPLNLGRYAQCGGNVTELDSSRGGDND